MLIIFYHIFMAYKTYCKVLLNLKRRIPQDKSMKNVFVSTIKSHQKTEDGWKNSSSIYRSVSGLLKFIVRNSFYTSKTFYI